MGWGGRVAALAMRRRRSVLLASALLSLTGLASLATLRLDIDLLETLPAGEPAFDEFNQYLKTFGGTQTLVTLVTGVPPEALPRAIDLLTERYRRFPETGSVTSGLDRDAAAAYLTPVNVPALVPAERFPELAARLTPEAIAAALARAKATLAIPAGSAVTEHVRRDPLGLVPFVGTLLRERYQDPISSAADRHVLSRDGDAGLIITQPVGSPFDAPFTLGLFQSLTGAEQEVRNLNPAFRELRVQHAGAYAHAIEDQRLLREDFFRYGLLALIGVVATFQLGYRNAAILPLIAYLLAAGSLLDFAISALVYGQLNALSLSFTAIFYGLAVDAGIHFYSRLLTERRNAPLEEAVVRTCDGIATANVVASTTTGAAFAVVAFSSIPALQQIGALTALGMLINIAHTFIVLPALTVTFPGRLATDPPALQDTPRLGWLAGASARHPALVLGCAAALVVIWVVRVPAVPVDAEVLNLRPAASPATEAEDEIEARFGTLVPDAFALIVGRDLESTLQREERIVAWLEKERLQEARDREDRAASSVDDGHRAGTTGAIVRYQALSTFLPSEAAERARRAAFAALPLARARDAFHTELARQGFRSKAFGEAERIFEAADARLPRDEKSSWLTPLLARHLRRDARGVTLAVSFTPAPDTAVLDLRDRLRGVDPEIILTGRKIMQATLAGVIRREVVLFTLFTFALNVVILLLQVRRIVPALTLLAPTVLVVIALLAGMQLGGVPFTPINLVALPLALGIGVDNCVYLAERVREGHDVESAVRSMGRAVALTSLTTMVGFGFLAISHYPGLAGLGWLATVAIGLTFVGAIVILPALLAVVPLPLPPVRRST